MTTREVIRVLDQDAACARILAAGYSKQPCAACESRGFHDSAAFKTFTDAPDRIRKRCEACEGSGYTWQAPTSQP